MVLVAVLDGAQVHLKAHQAMAFMILNGASHPLMSRTQDRATHTHITHHHTPVHLGLLALLVLVACLTDIVPPHPRHSDMHPLTMHLTSLSILEGPKKGCMNPTVRLMRMTGASLWKRGGREQGHEKGRDNTGSCCNQTLHVWTFLGF